MTHDRTRTMALATFKYRKLLLTISKDLRDGEFQELKILCRDLIPPGKSEPMTTGQLLFTGLEEEGLITAGDVGLLKEILEPVRMDLISKVEDYEKQYAGVAALADKMPKGLEGQTLTEEIIRKVGGSLARDWRSLARCLKMKNDDILKIASDNRDSLEEQGVQMLFKWFKDFGDARANDTLGEKMMRASAANVLDDALRRARLSSIADQNFGRDFLLAREEPRGKMGN